MKYKQLIKNDLWKKQCDKNFAGQRKVESRVFRS